MDRKEKALTAKEKIRKEEFDKFCIQMGNQGYDRYDLTVGITAANTLGVLLTVPFVAVFVWIYLTVNPLNGINFTVIGPLLFLLVFFVLIVFHELIHGITWSCFTQNRMKDIEFGVMWKYITPYCTCRKPLKKGQYITGALMPTVVLGFLPAIASIITGSLFAFAIAELMIMSCRGDFLIVTKALLYHTRSKDAVFCDHPYEAGLVVFDKLKTEETN